MILTKNERARLQKIIHGELQKTEESTPVTSLLFVISALLSDFDELESILSKTYSAVASGKEISELLDSLAEVLSSDLIDKLHFEGQSELIKSLTLLANNARNLKSVLAGIHDKKYSIVQ